MSLFDQGGLELGELDPEVAKFIKTTRESNPDHEYDQGARFEPPKHANDDEWLSSGKSPEVECDEHTILIRYGPKKKLWSITYIGCGACRFNFERTKVSVARSWAEEHNLKDHGGSLTVVDSTRPEGQ